MKLYSDVDNNHWANGVIAVGTTVPSDANGQAMLQGYPDGSFKPENNVTYAELAKMLVVLAKKDLTADDVVKANNQWATLWLRWAAELGILDDVTVANSDAPATRGDAFTMVYNALYKMVSFKRQAANDEIGVLSSLRNDKLVLNQDEKQEYTLTTETNFVRPYDENNVRSNVVKVKNITNPDYYLGSLVRIIYNDNKEVTHILELGNPESLALGNNTNAIRPADSTPAIKNDRWEGVAKYTVETGFTNVAKANDVNNLYAPNGYITVQTKSDRTEVTGVTFHYANGTVVKQLDVNDDTKVYVANPGNNQMKKVDSIDAAMTLIGYHNYNANYKIPNVYAGFDNSSFEAAYRPARETHQDLAKVIVFNTVNRAKSGDKFRIINETSIPGNIVLEKKDGSLVERNNLGSISNFPYNYGDLLDVVSIMNFETRGYDERTVIIDHSDTKLFPIVEVTAIDKDSKTLSVRGADNYSGNIYYRDADVFSAKRYDKLEVGTKLQFRLDTDHAADYKNPSTLEVSAISLLPRDTELKGSLRAVLGDRSINADRIVGYVRNINDNRVTFDIYTNPLDKDSAIRSVWFDVTDDVAAAIRSKGLIVPGREIDPAKALTVLTEEIRTGKKVADLRYNNDGHTIVETYTAPTKILNALETLEAEAEKGKATQAQVNQAETFRDTHTRFSEIDAIQKRIDKALKRNAEVAINNYAVAAPDFDVTPEAKADLASKANAAYNLYPETDQVLQDKLDKANADTASVAALIIDRDHFGDPANVQVSVNVPRSAENVSKELKSVIENNLESGTTITAFTVTSKIPNNGEYYSVGDEVRANVTLKNGNISLNITVKGEVR